MAGINGFFVGFALGLIGSTISWFVNNNYGKELGFLPSAIMIITFVILRATYFKHANGGRNEDEDESQPSKSIGFKA